MRKYNELNILTKNGHLAKFAKYKKNQNYSDYLLLDDFLNSYGIGLFGSYKVHENFSVHGLTISAKDFYAGNWKIIEEFYAWTNLKVDIGVMGFTSSSEQSICFIEYNTEKSGLVLKELSVGFECFRKEYDSFDSLWEEISKYETIDELKELVV